MFARAPLAGRAKTRLAVRLGEHAAARLQARLTELAVGAALAARVGPVLLYATPKRRHPRLLRLARERGLVLRAQRGRDLGERMSNALGESLRRFRHVVLVGSDCPSLGARDIAQAVRALRGGCDAAISPAEDGGYALIALRRASPRLFERMEWGRGDVCAETRGRLAALGRRWRELRTVWDIDRPADLDRYRVGALKARRALRPAPRPLRQARRAGRATPL